ncbi:Reverse transcriptase, partial [Phytophthora palmivora]
MPPPTVEPDERLLVVSFDGSARVKRSGGAYSGIVWSLPDWTVISAASRYKLDLTVNEAEYHAKDDAATVKIAAVTRSRKKCRPQVLQEEIVQRMRMERISRAQNEEKWIVDLKAYLRGDSVQRYVGQCIDCETGKGRPTIHGESPGNLQATYPFQIIGMDHIPSLPR